MSPYENLSELPSGLQHRLPLSAQEIYLSVFNNIWQKYSDAPCKESGSQEEVSHKVAWAAVKQAYYKANGHWELKEE